MEFGTIKLHLLARFGKFEYSGLRRFPELIHLCSPELTQAF